jgi:hypothetical protein
VRRGFLNSNPPRRYMCKMEQICGTELSHHIGMKMKDLTKKQISSVRCPTCGVAVGRRCELSTGQLRFEAHVDRRLSAAELVGSRSKR